MIQFLYSDFFQWYYDNQNNNTYFTNEPDLEYQFYYRNSMGGYSLSKLSNPENVYFFSKSLRFIHIKYKNTPVLIPPFDKLYLQLEPKNGTIYFITPKIDSNDFVWGDHYRFHYVWAEEKFINNSTKTISDIVGFHKTIQNIAEWKTDHKYCNFKNKYCFDHDINYIIDPISFNNIVCINLNNFTNKYNDNVFNNPDESNMIKDIINIPFNPTMAQMTGGRTKRKQTIKHGGSINNVNVKLSNNHNFNKIHLIKIKYKNIWHVTVNMYCDNLFIDRFGFKTDDVTDININKEIKKYMLGN